MGAALLRGCPVGRRAVTLGVVAAACVEQGLPAESLMEEVLPPGQVFPQPERREVGWTAQGPPSQRDMKNLTTMCQ